jgi:hypothetical protein
VTFARKIQREKDIKRGTGRRNQPAQQATSLEGLSTKIKDKGNIKLKL